MIFDNSAIDVEILKQRAFNMRWAQQPAGVIPLTAADGDFPCAPEITEAISQYMSKRFFSYGPAEGLTTFRNAICNSWYDERKINWEPQHILPVDSAAQGMFVIAKTFLNPGDEAIIFDPVDFLFKAAIENAKGVAKLLPINVISGKYDVEKLESLINPKTKMICLCNPHNPSGKVFSREELLQIGQIAVENNLWIMNDEVWSDIVYPPVQFCSMAALDKEIRQRTITVYGFSKAYALAGLRVGFIAAPGEEAFKKIYKASLVETTACGVSTISQIAAQAALEHAAYWRIAFVAHLKKMRDMAFEKLNKIKNIQCHLPDGCFIMFPSITATNLSSAEFADYLLQQAKVAVVPGIERWFGKGAEGHIRLSYATSQEILEEALNRIESACNKIN